MMIVPSRFPPAHAIRIFADSHDASLRYVDALVPAAMDDRAPRWMALPGGQVLLLAELRFGPDEAALRRAAGPGQHATSAPWEVSPVCAWGPADPGARLLARGNTSGYGAHNVVLSATLPSHSPVVVAAELGCHGRLDGARITARLPAPALHGALEHAGINQRAAWDQPLAGALLALIDQMLASRAGTLAIERRGLQHSAIAELRELARLELANKIARSWLPHATSLAGPAALAGASIDTGGHDIELTWANGDSVPVRAVRTLRIASKGDSNAESTSV